MNSSLHGQHTIRTGQEPNKCVSGVLKLFLHAQHLYTIIYLFPHSLCRLLGPRMEDGRVTGLRRGGKVIEICTKISIIYIIRVLYSTLLSSFVKKSGEILFFHISDDNAHR